MLRDDVDAGLYDDVVCIVAAACEYLLIVIQVLQRDRTRLLFWLFTKNSCECATYFYF